MVPQILSINVINIGEINNNCHGKQQGGKKGENKLIIREKLLKSGTCIGYLFLHNFVY